MPRAHRSAAALILLCVAAPAGAEELQLALRYQQETSPGSGRFHRLTRAEQWNPAETAVIVCDVWDLHHCRNAVRRLEEFAPRLDQVLAEARRRGCTIIHAPSDCMPAYADHPARRRAMETPPAESLPPDIRSWCSRIPAEERGVYPIDQSDGGEDDDPAEHARWAAKLQALGRNPGTPWQRQSKLITIDPQRDYISDRGDEVWNVLADRGIQNVILAGVHTNMCVLGRPFGLRQMVRGGKHVVLMRDMTDTMYNPARWPYVDHHTGTDLVIAHIERFVCPTITSDQLLGGEPFRFRGDTRPHLAIVMAEDEYETARTLPAFASRHLGRHLRVSYVFGDDRERNRIPGLEVLEDADALLVSVRRRLLPEKDMARVRRFVKAGKPVVGIRTASHAFALRRGEVPAGMADWSEFDAEVFGGNYHGHHGNQLRSTVRPAAGVKHPVLAGLPHEGFVQGGSLYKTSPLAQGTLVLASGYLEGQPELPVAWTFRRADGGRSFYTSLGHPDDFDNPAFVRLLVNGIYWAAGLPPREDVSFETSRAGYVRHWSPLPVPASWEAASAGVLKDYDGPGWYRCVVRVPRWWLQPDGLRLTLRPGDDRATAWFNGHALQAEEGESGAVAFPIEADWIELDDANLLVVRVDDRGGEGGLRQAPVLRSGDRGLALKGRWQFRLGDDPSLAAMPLPAKFGGSTDIYFEPPRPKE